MGVVRVYDVSNRCLPKLLKIERYCEGDISIIKESPNRKHILIGSKGSKDFWVLNAQNLEFECYVTLPSPVQDVCWLQLGSNTLAMGIL